MGVIFAADSAGSDSRRQGRDRAGTALLSWRNPRVELRDPYVRRVLEQAFPDAEARYFSQLNIGSTPTTADGGAETVLGGTKTTTSSAVWVTPTAAFPS
jgi:hypothetical protein